MWARFCCSLVMFLHILSLVEVSSRLFPPNHGFALNNQVTGSVQIHSSNQIKGLMGSLEKEERLKEIKKIGSKPPRCEHRCHGCMPCEAIQVPTTTSHVAAVLYTNYEPEGWKCKCGPTFYTP